MGSVGKVAAFSALIRVFKIALPRRIDDWRTAILVLALLTLVVGSVLVFGTFKGVAKFGIIRVAVSFESYALAVVAMLAFQY